MIKRFKTIPIYICCKYLIYIKTTITYTHMRVYFQNNLQKPQVFHRLHFADVSKQVKVHLLLL